MHEIEPTIENVRKGDTVTIEKGAPGEPGHALFTYLIARSLDRMLESHEVTVDRVQTLTESGAVYRITRIDRPAPPIPAEPGVRFWARRRSTDPREYIVTNRGRIVGLSDGETWNRDLFERNHTVVPAPEPEAVPVPADLIREAEEWVDCTSKRLSCDVLRGIVRAVREREGES